MLKRICLGLIMILAPIEDANASCAAPGTAEPACAEAARPARALSSLESVTPEPAASPESTGRYAPLGVRARLLESRYP
ncbi:MAG: hypothetical protein EOP11_05930 [Proteobacteria bacterium]|nr:MAG: hypothetical protein EOP11_05930 [Pseudomonadota bacterium]